MNWTFTRHTRASLIVVVVVVGSGGHSFCRAVLEEPFCSTVFKPCPTVYDTIWRHKGKHSDNFHLVSELRAISFRISVIFLCLCWIGAGHHAHTNEWRLQALVAHRTALFNSVFKLRLHRSISSEVMQFSTWSQAALVPNSKKCQVQLDPTFTAYIQTGQTHQLFQ